MADKTSNQPAASSRKPMSFMKNSVHYSNGALRVGASSRRSARAAASGTRDGGGREPFHAGSEPLAQYGYGDSACY